MFHPQPTPFASSPCFASDLPSNGIGIALGFGIPPPPQARNRARGGAVAAAGAEPDTGLRYLYGGGSSGPSPSEAAPHQHQPQHHNHHHHHHHHFFPHHHLPHHHPRPLHYRAAAAMDDHDMAAQQEAAKDYRPVLEGPLVGDKTSSNAITHEYAKADQVYVEKTMALPQTYSHYRPIQGDGNCGWRDVAIGFSYFEKLIEMANPDAIQAEVSRLVSYNQTLHTVGGYSYFEDWAEEMTGLMRDLAGLVADQTAARALLMHSWNDESIESALIYYLRLLAATYLKSNADTYDPFVPGAQGISAYCSQSMELPNREIEHLGIVALFNILLQPAGIALEIAYLDLSPGSQVNHHRFTDETPGQNAPPPACTVFLLYRPDHYDILYRALEEAASSSSPPAPSPPTEPVNVFKAAIGSHEARISSNNPNLAAFSTMDFSGALSMIPGLSAISPAVDAFSPPPPQSSWTAPFISDDTRQTAPTTRTPPSQSPTTMGTLGSSSVMGGALGVDTAPQKHTPLVRTAGEVTAAGGYPIRFSPVQLDYEESKNSFRESSFQVKTNTFKNSIWNRAHYGNPDFHPEEWSPDEESVDGRAAGKRRGKKERES
ncbi:hypothetical protein CP532_5630 [Ophiocordyceps camponoti-leonardi (nom. inval.)]|nr:hypothetical protein CP532_5630 [Ophiocordyceps camponoti-leonardi (nom. inval.)]